MNTESTTNTAIDDLRIKEIKELSTPASLIAQVPVTAGVAHTVAGCRNALHKILHGADDRLIVVIGPCSIHDSQAALQYATRLVKLRAQFAEDLEIVMRVYFEKPRTTVGWKGLINDPDLDGSFQINKGLRLAREVLCNINSLGLPAGTEFLDMITPQFIADLVSWGAIGARTTESQIHRELASGLSCPVGFKNGTDGNVKIAVDAIKAAQHPHHFLSVTKEGRSAIVSTAGNEDCHVILRGGKAPNFDAESVEAACTEVGKGGLAARIMIDASHGNSSKVPKNQIAVCASVAEQLAEGEQRIMGVMVESHLVEGRQDLEPGKLQARALTFGQSITDACIGWDDSEAVLEILAEGVRKRRLKHGGE
ncbi:MAG: 3-deoxy-7-phosphoheptulonate synthase AroG [Limnobacter sp.]|nr:3-deoxy-7-phosphoheptulonate synthase AroG [Limnobacter sp.]